MKVKFEERGDFNTTLSWLNKQKSGKDYVPILRQIGDKGVAALEQATPTRTGETARGWSYKLKKTGYGYDVIFVNNSHPETSANVAVLIQLGHGTGTGGYVPGIDYINPALKPVFEWGSKALGEAMKR